MKKEEKIEFTEDHADNVKSIGKHIKSQKLKTINEDLKFIRFHKLSLYPVRAHGATYKYIVSNINFALLKPSESVNLATGIKFRSSNEENVALLLGRSPTPDNGLEIESKFFQPEEHVIVSAHNRGDSPIEIDPFSSIAKIVILKCSGGDPVVVENIDEL